MILVPTNSEVKQWIISTLQHSCHIEYFLEKLDLGNHDTKDVIEIAKSNPPHKTPWMLEVIPKMSALEQPKLELITTLKDFPNIRLTDKTYNAIVNRTNEVIAELKNKPYYL